MSNACSIGTPAFSIVASWRVKKVMSRWVMLRPPRDKEEREAWEAQGHRAGTIEPSVDRPLPWIALRGRAQRERYGDGKRQLWRKPGQPSVLLFHLRGDPLDAGQSYDHVVAQPIESVARSCRHHRLESKVGPLRKLRVEQAAHER